MRLLLPIILIVVCIAFLVTLFFAPLNIYLDFYSKVRPNAISVDGNPISWQQFKDELNLVSNDKNLKTRGAKIEAAINQGIERQLLKQVLGPAADSLANLTPYFQLQQLKNSIQQESVNWKTGGYFIARFTVPNATESAQLLKDRAKAEITKLKDRLDKGEAFQKLLDEANKNSNIAYLNSGAFLPGMYLDKVTEDKFPLKIKSFREQFFKQPANTVSDIFTLSWDDYDGQNYGGNFTGEFAYAVIKIDEENPQSVTNYESWLKAQKEKIKIQSFVFIPFFFRWF